jgi:DivIVA domain-containing protein
VGPGRKEVVVVIVFVVVAAVVVFAVAATAVGRGGGLDAADPDLVAPWLPGHDVTPEDVAAVRFAVAFRGYRMDQVDDVLERLGEELTARDQRIAALEGSRPDPPPESGSSG